MDRCTVGRIIHVIVAGKHLPAIVTSVPTESMSEELAKNNITACVFPDGNVMREATVIRTIAYDEMGKLWGSWHWPERDE